MKKLFVFALIVVSLCTSSYFDISEQEFNLLEEKGLLRNLGIGVYGNNVVDKKETALKIAEAVTRELYGNKVKAYLPFDADEDLNFPQEWRVRSAKSKIVCHNGLFGPNIGGPEVHIRKYDGAVTFITFWR